MSYRGNVLKNSLHFVLYAAFSHWGCAEDYVLRDDGYHYIDDDDEDDDSGDHIAAPASPKLYLTSALDNDAGDQNVCIHVRSHPNHR